MSNLSGVPCIRGRTPLGWGRGGQVSPREPHPRLGRQALPYDGVEGRELEDELCWILVLNSSRSFRNCAWRRDRFQAYKMKITQTRL